MTGASGEWEFADELPSDRKSWKIPKDVQARRDEYAARISRNEQDMMAGKPSSFPLTSEVIPGATYPRSGYGVRVGGGWGGPQPQEYEFADTAQESKEFSIKDNLLGLGVGLTDLIGGLPGAAVSTAVGAADLIMGRKPSEALVGTQGAMTETLPSKLVGKIPGLKEPEAIKQTKGYELGMKPAELIGDAIKFIGKGYGEIAKSLGITESDAKEVSAGTEMGIMIAMLGLGARGRTGKAPTPAELRTFYDQSISGKTFNQSRQSIDEARKSYPPEDPNMTTRRGGQQELALEESYKPKTIQEDIAPNPNEAGVLQGPVAQVPFMGDRRGGILDPETIRRLEEELNPPAEMRGMVPAPDLRGLGALERRAQPRMEEAMGQGELFTQERPYAQGETFNGLPIRVEEALQSNRDRVAPVVTDRLQQMGEMTSREGFPYEMQGPDRPGQAPRQMTLEQNAAIREAVISDAVKRTEQFVPQNMMEMGDRPLTDMGTIGEARARVAEANESRSTQTNLAGEGIPYTGQPSLPVGPGRRQAGFIGFDRTARKKGVAQALIEHRRDFDRDSRPLPEIAKEMMDSKTPDISSIKTGLGRTAIPKQMAILTQNKIVKWAVDHMADVERSVSNNISSVLMGDTFSKNKLGFEKRIPGKDGALTAFRGTYNSGPSGRGLLNGMRELWLEKIGKEKITAESFKNPKQWEVFSAMRKGLDRTHKDLNAAQVKAGKKPFEYVENYFPSMWEGDYRVWIKNEKGEIIKAVGAETRWQAEAIAKEFRKLDSKLTVNSGPIAKGKYDLSDLSAFEEIARVLDKEGNHKLSAEFDRIAANIMAHRGAASHGLKRKGVEGFLGSESGLKGLQSMERAYETYVNKVYRYIGNLEKARLQSELTKLDPNIKEAQKNAIAISQDFLSQARGVKDHGKGITSLVEWLGENSGFGKNAARRGLQNLSPIMYAYWLLTGKQIIANWIQPTGNLAELSKLKETGQTNVSPIVALMKGYDQLRSADKLAIEGANYVGRQGYLDPTVTNLLQFSREGSSISKKRIAGELVRHIPGLQEHHMVRLPSFLMYEYALRDSIKDPKTRYKKAAEIMDDRMVNYSESNTPLMYNDMGIVGDVLKPLKQYPHNAWGQLLDYAAFAKDTGKVAPLAYFLGNQLTMAGMKGLAFIPEVTAVILFYNWLLNEDIPTPEHAMMTSEMPGVLIHGGLSTALGVDISRSVAHPSLPVNISSAPLVFGITAVKDTFNWMVHYLKGTATDADAMKAWLAITPNAFHGAIEEIYTQPGGFVPNPNQDMTGVYRRNDTERLIAGLFDMRSNNEAKERAFISGAYMLLSQDMKQRTEALNRIVDLVSNNKPIPDSLLEKYVNEGGSPDRLQRDIVNRLKARELSPVERIMQHPDMTIPKAHKLERLKGSMGMPKETPEYEFADEPRSSVEDSGVRPVGFVDTRPGKVIYKERPNYPIGKIETKGTADNIPRARIMRNKRGEVVGETRI